ncbi:MAG: YafY family transcriptional regulator [Chloroflexota bacterium]|nr:YafY family transcriptional regulator [Chloroflexota bacterium]
MVYRPTARVLATLELLQVHGGMTGAELARRLEVNGRTVRNYVETLRDLGVPVEATRGRAGGYRLRPGMRLPPLMFSEDEAVALVLGLLIAQRSGLADEVHLPGILARIERMLPETTRARVEAVAGTAVEPSTGKPAPRIQMLSALAEAARAARRVRLSYRLAAGDATEREFDCYGVGYCDEAWYAIGYCHLRQSQRLFRLDRIAAVTSVDATFSPHAGFDPLAAIRSALAAVPRRWAVSVMVRASLDEVRSGVALSPGHFTSCGERSTRIQVEVDDLRWMARLLAGSGLPFVIETPLDLADAIRDYAAELVIHAEG